MRKNQVLEAEMQKLREQAKTVLNDRSWAGEKGALQSAARTSCSRTVRIPKGRRTKALCERHLLRVLIARSQTGIF